MFKESKTNRLSSLQSSPIPTEQQYLIDGENDGVYTNYKHHFTFKYPSEVFDKQSVWNSNDINSERWNQQSWGRSLDGTLADKKFLELATKVQGIDKTVGYPASHDFNEAFSLEPGKWFSDGLGMKLKNYERRGVKGSIFYFKIPSGVLYNFPVYLYSAEFPKDSRLYFLQMMSNDYKTLKNNEKVFMQIADSFEFLD